MLDRSVPFHTIILMRPYQPAPEQPALPGGFTLRAYTDGDEYGWARIETEVLEFPSESSALDCHRHYMDSVDELKRRQWFIISPEGDYAATATAWWTNGENGRIPVVHALACRPKYQGLGLGRAVAARMLETFYQLEPNRDVWLDTQTWSYRAVGLYLKLGFIPMKTAVYNKTPNEYAAALPILKEHMRADAFERFVTSAV